MPTPPPAPRPWLHRLRGLLGLAAPPPSGGPSALPLPVTDPPCTPPTLPPWEEDTVLERIHVEGLTRWRFVVEPAAKGPPRALAETADRWSDATGWVEHPGWRRDLTDATVRWRHDAERGCYVYVSTAHAHGGSIWMGASGPTELRDPRTRLRDWVTAGGDADLPRRLALALEADLERLPWQGPGFPDSREGRVAALLDTLPPGTLLRVPAVERARLLATVPPAVRLVLLRHHAAPTVPPPPRR